MRIHRMLGVAVFVLVTAGLNAMPSRSDALNLNPPLTPREQALRLRALATPDTAPKLFPTAATELRLYSQTNYRRAYGSALQYDRARLAERIGDQGRARFGGERGWSQLLGSENRGLRQGPDSVYWDRRAGVVRVLEAKGGNARPLVFYGARQSTNEYAIRSARRLLRSPVATGQARIAAARVIVAGQDNRLVTGVVRTPNTLGRPGVPRLEGSWNRANVRREARAIERNLIRANSGTRQIFRAARRQQSTTMLKYRATQGVAILGLAGAAGLVWDAYQNSRVAWGMFDDPALQGTLLPHMQAGVAIGRIGQATSLGVSSAAQLAIFNLSAGAGAVQAANAALLPVTFGVEGLRLAVAYYEYKLGLISQRDLYRRATPAVVVTGATTFGAIIGGIVALPAGGVTGAAGAVLGAKIGAAVAIPFQLAADSYWRWSYRDFDDRQRRLVTAAVDRFYGLEAGNEADPR